MNWSQPRCDLHLQMKPHDVTGSALCPEVNRDAEATAASLWNLYSNSVLQRKQVIVEGNDGQQKNEEALNVYCNYG